LEEIVKQMGVDVMHVAEQQMFSAPTNKGANMKQEWKVCNVQIDHILDGEPESSRCCPIALAIEEIINNDDNYKKYSPVIPNATDMYLDRSSVDDDAKVIPIEVFEGDTVDVDNFILDFDATYDDETAPLPLPMQFRYRIKRSK
jgi:hypothetical protein|tara:strand:- start:32 stop:463 length:432 start_codon:yes stop_codon:yes gene_type:complete